MQHLLIQALPDASCVKLSCEQFRLFVESRMNETGLERDDIALWVLFAACHKLGGMQRIAIVITNTSG